jgi:hypothetical protein
MRSMCEMKLPSAQTVATQVLEKASIVGPPTDLGLVLRLWPRLHVSETELDGDGVFVDCGPGAGEVLLQKHAHPKRKRFTLAHEIGHFALLETLRHEGGDLSACASSSIEPWCDKFAASLLLPKAWVIRYLRSLSLNQFIEGILRGPAIFDVSNQAFRFRVAEIAPLSIFVLARTRNELRLQESFQSSIVQLTWKPAFLDLIERQRSEFTWEQTAGKFGEALLLSRWIIKTASEQRCLAVLMPEKSAQALAA